MLMPTHRSPARSRALAHAHARDEDNKTWEAIPEGLHVLERFITKNCMAYDSLQELFATQPICIKLLHLERRSLDDEIIVTQSVITALFRRFAGREPNYITPDAQQDQFEHYHERSKGIALSDGTSWDATGRTRDVQFCFAAVTALEWLCDFTSVVGREEAAEMAAQFVRFGLIELVSDKRKNNDSAIIFTVRGSAPTGDATVAQHGEFRCTAKAIYKITDHGKTTAQWDDNRVESPLTNLPKSSGDSSTTVDSGSSTVVGGNGGASTDAKIHCRISMAEKLNTNYEEGEKQGLRESNADRLRYILEEPQLRALFREFLKANICEENLSFWLDVKDFKRKFNITSSATALTPANHGRGTPGQAAMEKHHESLIHTAFVSPHHDHHNQMEATASRLQIRTLKLPSSAAHHHPCASKIFADEAVQDIITSCTLCSSVPLVMRL
ncbi:hypothetical protein HWV62_6162 [Athelia sp. TMB]|nr:hypothetical protein HWV62_6162 [Athelia sp. TMB]